MTVKKLIQLLTKMPEDAKVFKNVCCGSCPECNPKQLMTYEVLTKLSILKKGIGPMKKKKILLFYKFFCLGIDMQYTICYIYNMMAIIHTHTKEDNMNKEFLFYVITEFGVEEYGYSTEEARNTAKKEVEHENFQNFLKDGSMRVVVMPEDLFIN